MDLIWESCQTSEGNCDGGVRGDGDDGDDGDGEVGEG